MRVAILASGNGWHVQDVLRAAAVRGVFAELLDFRKLTAAEPRSWRAGSVSDRRKDNPNVKNDRHESALPPVAYAPGSPRPDALLVRTMPAGSLEQVIFRMDALAAAHGRGTIVVNAPKALETCIDKYLTTHRLAAAGLPVPRTWVGERADAAMEAFVELGGDVCVKPLFGSEGRGIVRVTDPELAWRAFTTIERLQGVIYQQEFIRHAGWDLRVFVLGGRVLAAMRRYSRSDWRTNVTQGGQTEPAAATASEERLALAAAQAVGCDIAGVDLLPGPDGYLVLEVNAVPGWRALSAACDVDVASAIVDYLMKRANR